MGVENYLVGELVGEGSYGKVHKGRRKFTGQTVAMKFILKRGKYKEEIQDLRKEIKILRTLKHENIIQMLDSFESPEYICVVTEFAQGELFKIHEDDKCLPEEEVQKIAKQLVRALDYLHSSGIVHRDMKPQNILICAGSVVKLCDFGFARAMSANTVVLQSIKGTPLYMAPEIVQQKKYNHTADLWSTGVILYELFVGQPPFNTESFGALFEKIKKDRVKYPDSMSSNFRSFLTGLLIKDRHSRLTWPKLLNHPFVAETFEDVEARELRANTAASRGCDAAWKGEHHVQTTTLAYAPEGSGFLLNVGSSGGKVSADDKDMVRAIKEHIKKYRQKVELKDAAVEVILLGKDLLNPNIMRRLLDNSSPREVILDVLSIVSDLAFMDKNIYEHIKGADILELLKRFLTHEHPNVRAKACNAIANMCRHSSYFYRLLAKHNIITLLVDRCSDEDKRTRNFSCYAIGNAAYHNDFLYEELRRCIPQLAKLLLSAEEDITKANASGALRNLVRNSNKLCDDIVSTGAMEALMKLVADYSAVALNPSRRDAINESPLERALYSLSKMCDHSPCRQFLRLSDLYPVIGRLRESKEANIATNATNIYNKTRDA